MSNGIVAAEISVPTDTFELGQILQDDTALRIELTHFVPIERTLVPHFWAEADDHDSLEAAIRADDRVAQLVALDGTAGKTLYRIEWATEINGLIAALRDHDLIIETAVGTNNWWWFRIRGPDHGTLGSFQDRCQQVDVPITVERVWQPNETPEGRYDLTAAQAEALSLAFTEGYFAVPRQVTLTELGDTLGITSQSVSRRLARGLHAVLSTTIMDESMTRGPD